MPPTRTLGASGSGVLGTAAAACPVADTGIASRAAASAQMIRIVRIDRDDIEALCRACFAEAAELRPTVNSV